MLPLKFVQIMDPIQFPFPPHNDGFNVLVLVQRSSKMRHGPEGMSSEIAIKSLNWSKETGIVAAVASAKSWAWVIKPL